MTLLAVDRSTYRQSILASAGSFCNSPVLARCNSIHHRSLGVKRVQRKKRKLSDSKMLVVLHFPDTIVNRKNLDEICSLEKIGPSLSESLADGIEVLGRKSRQ